MASLNFVPKEQFTALALQVAALQGLYQGAVANSAALKALSTVSFKDGALVLIEATGVLYRFNLGEATGSESPPDTYDATDAGGVYHITVADDQDIHRPVADTAALAVLDLGGALSAGVSCLVVNRGDGYAWRYRYVVGATPDPDYGTIGGVRVYVTGTNGYWTPEDLPAYLLLAETFDRQRLGDISGGVLGAASTWTLSSEGNNVNGHGFTLDWDGAHPEEVVVVDAIKDLATSITLTELYLNLAIQAQCAVTNNARARFVYSETNGAYALVFPPDVDTAAVAVTAPALANDISIAAKLAVETVATGTLATRMGRNEIEALRVAVEGIKWLPPAISFWAFAGGAPVLPTVGDRYVASSGGGGLSATHVYEWNGATWTDTTPEVGMAITVNAIDLSTNHPAGQYHYANENNSLDWYRTAVSKGSIGTAVLSLSAGIFAAGDHVDVGGVAFTASAAPTLAHEFALTGILETEINGLVAIVNTVLDNAVPVKASQPDVGSFMVKYATTNHTTEIAATPSSIPLAVTVTPGLTGTWDKANLNESGSAPAYHVAHGHVVVSAEMEAAIAADVAFIAGIPFPISATSTLTVTVRDTTGALRTPTDLFALEVAPHTVISITGAGATHIVATDIIDWVVYA